jgi:hypothetical protein
VIGQVIIGLTGVLAIILLHAKRPSVRRWAPTVGLVGQPFWLLTSYDTQAWGMLFVSLMYTWVWLVGAYLAWRPANTYRQRV